MSNSIQNKLLNHEVVPPETAWEGIAAELNDVNFSNKLSSSLSTVEVAPPVSAWGFISASLDEDHFTKTVAGKLSSAEIEPPAGAWKSIEDAITETQKVIPVTKGKTISFWKYAAAAVITGAIAWGSVTLLNTRNNSETLAAAQETTDTSNTHQPPAGDNTSITDISNLSTAAENDNDDARNDAALEASKKIYASVDVPKLKSRMSEAANFYFAPTDAYNINRVTDNHQTDGADEASLADRYYMMVTSEGKIVRMSKKLGHLACCISGEDHDTECVNQLKRWQEKLAKQPGTHSPGNFSDLMELVCALEEK